MSNFRERKAILWITIWIDWYFFLAQPFCPFQNVSYMFSWLWWVKSLFSLSCFTNNLMFLCVGITLFIPSYFFNMNAAHIAIWTVSPCTYTAILITLSTRIRMGHFLGHKSWRHLWEVSPSSSEHDVRRYFLFLEGLRSAACFLAGFISETCPGHLQVINSSLNQGAYNSFLKAGIRNPVLLVKISFKQKLIW